MIYIIRQRKQLVIYIINVESEDIEEDISMLSKIQNKGLKYITLINKTDKVQKNVLNEFMEELKKYNLENIIPISVEEEIGIEDLKNKIEDIFNTSHLDYKNTLIITNERHKDLLKKAIGYLNEAFFFLDNS